MKKILVPTDFSKTAGNAMTYALEIASRTGCEVTVVHIIGPYEGVDNSAWNAVWINQYNQQKTLALQSWVQKYRRNAAFKTVPIHTDVRTGFTAAEIADMADRQHFDLVVMGTTGASGLKELLLGSVAGRVITHSKVPTLAVPKNGSFHRLATVVLATDFLAELNRKSLTVLRRLLEIESAPLDVLHVLEPGSPPPDKNREHLLRSRFEGINLRFHYLHNADVPVAITNFVESLEAHLVCSIGHSHGIIHRFFIESTSRLLAHHAKVPLLVLHD